MSSHFDVVYDACVLYPALLRDLLMHLALTDMYRAGWTQHIHDERMRTVLKQRPDLKPEEFQRTCSLMGAHVRGNFITGFKHRALGVGLIARRSNPPRRRSRRS
jgi:hypothetical protein